MLLKQMICSFLQLFAPASPVCDAPELNLLAADCSQGSEGCGTAPSSAASESVNGDTISCEIALFAQVTKREDMKK